MAGEVVEEPFRLGFQADSFRSGSISFGRYENESLCWERRSSFSHNRYLEEVEKCSKPGLVVEKKAYLEAHFRKKGIMGLSLHDSRNGTEYQTCENDMLEKTSYGDNIVNHTNTESNSPLFDDSQDGSVHGSENGTMENDREASEASISEARVDRLCNSENISEEIEVKEKTDGEAANLDTCHVSNESNSQFSHNHATEEDSDASLNDQQDSTLKENVLSHTEYTKPIQISVAKSGRTIYGKASKGSERIPGKSVNNVLMRPKPEKQTSAGVGLDKHRVHMKPKDELHPKARGVYEIIRGGKEPRSRRVEGPRPSTLQKNSNRVIQSENRIKPAVAATQPCVKQETSNLKLKCNEGAGRMKQFDMKLEKKTPAKEADLHQLKTKPQDKTEVERKQVRKSLNFKATPLPSFYRESNRNKAVTTNIRSQKQQPKSATTARISESSRLCYAADKNRAVFINRHPKTNDPPPSTSAATSCHSTVTSDSNQSSPAAEIGKSLPSLEVINSRIGVRKAKDEEKHKSLHNHKAIEHNKFYKGKTIDGKQNKKIADE